MQNRQSCKSDKAILTINSHIVKKLCKRECSSPVMWHNNIIIVNSNTVLVNNLDLLWMFVSGLYSQFLSPSTTCSVTGVESLPVISSAVSCTNCDIDNLREPVRYQIMVNQIVSTELRTIVMIINVVHGFHFSSMYVLHCITEMCTVIVFCVQCGSVIARTLYMYSLMCES